MSTEMERVLRELGWTEGAALPVADPHNRVLSLQMEAKMKRKAELIVEKERTEERLAGMKNMLKSVLDEKGRNEDVQAALKRQIESEATTLKLTEFQVKKTSEQVKNLKKELATIKDRDEKYQVEVGEKRRRVEELRGQVEWGEDALFAWEEDIAHGERDQSLMDHLRDKDDEALAQLYRRVEAARDEFNEVNRIQQQVVDRILCLERELDQTCQTIKAVNGEKTRLIEIWERTIQAVKTREEDINKKSLEMEEIKNSLREKYQKFLEKRSIYEKQKKINDEIDDEIQRMKISMQKMKTSNAESRADIQTMKKEVFVYQNTLGEVSSKVESQKAQNNELIKSFSVRKTHRDELREENSRMESILKAMTEKSLSAEQKGLNAEEVFKMGKKAQDRMYKELSRTQEVIGRLQTELPKISADTHARRDELADAENLDAHLDGRLEAARREVQELDVFLYNLEYQLTELNGKIFETKSKNTSEIVTLWKNKVQELEEKVKVKTSDYNELKNEMKKSVDDHQHVKNTVKRLEAERESMNEQIKQVGSIIEVLERNLKSAQGKHNESLLKLNLAKMHNTAVLGNIARQGSSASQLEKQRICLEAAMKERKLEIDAQKEMLSAKKKSLVEERSSLRRSVEHLNLRVKQLQQKYEIALGMLGRTEEGEQLTLTHFKIKWAQEKHELQEEGDTLEGLIVKAEKEIEAMESTLRLVCSANSTFRSNLDPISPQGPEMSEKNRLEMEYYKINSCLKEKKTLINQINTEIKELMGKLKEIEMEEESIQEEWKEKDKELGELERDLARKQDKLERADRMLARLKRDVARVTEPPGFRALAQRDIEVRLKSEQNRSGLEQLAELATNYLETGPMVTKYLSEKGLSLPKRGASLGSAKNSVSLSLISLSTKSLESLPSRPSSTELCSSKKSLCDEPQPCLTHTSPH